MIAKTPDLSPSLPAALTTDARPTLTLAQMGLTGPVLESIVMQCVRDAISQSLSVRVCKTPTQPPWPFPTGQGQKEPCKECKQPMTCYRLNKCFRYKCKFGAVKTP